jgi:glycosyltransferase involved in cell wall biosynthesis
LRNGRTINPQLLLSLRRTIRQTAPGIVQTWLPQMDVLGGLVAAQTRIPWIISERTSAEYYKQIPAFAKLRLFLSRYASAVVANSAAGNDYWQKSGSRVLRLATVRNALDFKHIEAMAGSANEGLPAKPLMLVVGRFDREKAHDIIVRAFGLLAEDQHVNALMMGEGREKASIVRRIDAASLSNRITIWPYQSDWWRWLKVADGLISMGRYEGNPNVALEAMAGGCPIILSDTPAHREIANAASALFVPQDDVRALSQAIVTLINEKDAARRRAEHAFNRVSSLTLSSMADAYEHIYTEVLSRNT